MPEASIFRPHPLAPFVPETDARTAALARLTDPDHVVLFDGAMGTELYARGVFINQCYDELNLRAPEVVRAVHAAYAAAGAEVLETNTFGANRIKLAHYGLEGQVAAINERGAAIAREAADSAEAADGRVVLVAGAVGPLGVRIEPYGPTGLDEARSVFAEQIAALLAGGADCLILETFGDLHELEQAVRAARDVAPGVPVIAQMTVGADLRTPYGATPAAVARALDGWGVDVIGLNCSVGPQAILDAIEQMAGATSRKLSAMPNAGLPREVGGRSIYMASAEYLATYARHLVHAGAKVVGGCCGTSPDHVRAMRQALRAERAMGRSEAGTRAAVARRVADVETPATVGVAPAPLAERSRFGAKLAAGTFVTSVEIVPPRGIDTGKLLTDAATLHLAGVDAINIPDGPRAQSRMGAVATALLIEQRVGIEAVTHYACRDRNLLGMLSDLLGAAALGLRNLLLVTGDPPKMGPYPDATAVFDVDAIGLTNLVANLNRGLDPGGNAIGTPTRFVVGVGVNPAAVDPAHELERFRYKIEAGAEYAITQPVFDPAQLETFLSAVDGALGTARPPVVAGVWPLVSARNAEFLANEVPGVTVPEAVLERMRRASARSKEHGVQEGIAIARETLARVRGLVQGVQVSAPFGRAELALEVLDGVTPASAAPPEPVTLGVVPPVSERARVGTPSGVA